MSLSTALGTVFSFLNLQINIGNTSLQVSSTPTTTPTTTPSILPTTTTYDATTTPIPAKQDVLPAADTAPKPTERVTPPVTGFNPLNLGTVAIGIFGTPYETGVTFRNTYNSSIAPGDISVMASTGLTSVLTQIVNNNGLSSFTTAGTTTFNGITMTYPQSESKIISANLQLNYNPLNIYIPLLELSYSNSTDENEKLISDFYMQLDISRERIFNINTDLHKVINELLEIHETHNLKKYSKQIELIYSSPKYFDAYYTIHEQMKNIVDVLATFTANYKPYLKFIFNSHDYVTKIDKLKELMNKFAELIVIEELKYIYEDLKYLRVRDGLKRYKKIKEA